MKELDLLFVAGSIRPHDEIKRNNACFRAGFLGSKIQGPLYSEREKQALDAGIIKKLPVYDRVLNRKDRHVAEVEASTKHFERLNKNYDHNREAAARIAEDYSLVQGRKSPTGICRAKKARLSALARLARYGAKRPHPLESTEAFYNSDMLYASTERTVAGILHEKGKINRDESSLAPVSFQIQHREWSGQYRGQLVTQTPSSSAPAANVGERFTKKLSKRSVSKIFESAAYTATCHGGFTTFLTATFDKTQRRGIFGGMDTGCEENDIGAHHPIGYKRNMVTYRSSPSVLRTESPVCNVAGPYTDIELDGHRRVMNLDREIVGDYCLLSQKPEKPFTMTKTLETTIGKEVSRLLDGMKKMYHRGWLADHTIQTDEESGAKYCDLNVEPVPGHKKNVTIDDVEMQAPADFHYIWVAECPANEEGEPNPHVHILLKWTVEPHLFSAWAKRCEKIWGHGFAKLERIREPKAAGTYIIKAVGYAAKGENADQGLIKGNRYNIAKCSRAPAWECIASFEAGNITAIIKELGYKLEQWKKPHKRKLNRLIKEKTQTIKAAGIAKDQNKPADALNKLQSRIIRLEKQAQKVQKDMKSKGVHASSENRFSISFDGDDAETKVDRFLSWAAGARGWSMDCRDGDLSEIKNNADVAYKTQYQQHLERRSYWASVFNDDAPMPEVDSLEIDYYQSLRSEYELSCSQVMQI